jgi:putative tryptophan/tyrosine transport system substrate-binding protein
LLAKKRRPEKRSDEVRRREFIVSSLVLASCPEVAAGQSPTRAVRIGWIVATSASASTPFLDAVRTGLADLGYAEGRNLTIEARYADDVPGRVPVLIEELLRIPVDVMVTQGPTTWEVVKNVTTVPVVYVFSADPVEAGFAQSFARPQGNSTGLTLMSVELNGKRLELARELVPALRRAAILANPDHRGEHLEREDSEEAARRLGITIQYLPVHNVAELDASFPALAAGESEAIVVFPDPVTVRNRQRIIDFAETRHLPVISGWAIFAQSVALCTYGPRLTESYKRAAYYVDRIVKGEKPGDLPIERPSVFELVVNLKTAKALGLTVPRAILARADEVIE